jgi:hypothetical protein
VTARGPDNYKKQWFEGQRNILIADIAQRIGSKVKVNVQHKLPIP